MLKATNKTKLTGSIIAALIIGASITGCVASNGNSSNSAESSDNVASENTSNQLTLTNVREGTIEAVNTSNSSNVLLEGTNYVIGSPGRIENRNYINDLFGVRVDGDDDIYFEGENRDVTEGMPVSTLYGTKRINCIEAIVVDMGEEHKTVDELIKFKEDQEKSVYNANTEVVDMNIGGSDVKLLKCLRSPTEASMPALYIFKTDGPLYLQVSVYGTNISTKDNMEQAVDVMLDHVKKF